MRQINERIRFDVSHIILPGIVVFGLCALVLRLWYLQVVRGEELSRLAVKSRTISVPIPASRGLIADRRNVLLANVKVSLAVMITPAEIHDNKEAISRLAQLLGKGEPDLEKEIQDNMYRKYLPFVAKTGITQQQATHIEEQRAFLPGVMVRALSVREYLRGESCAHALGYVGGLSEDDMKRISQIRDFLPNFTGKVGVERFYDDILLGHPGIESVEVDSRGNELRKPITTKPKQGDKLVLTIDIRLQEYATKLLNGRRGSVVAIDPATGEILCLVSSPSYDPSLFVKGISRREWDKLANDKNLPMHNRAVGSAYAPGSAFKIITLIAGIRTGLITPNTTYVCEGSIEVGNRKFRCLGVHGRVNYETAIEKSCNIYFAEIATRIPREMIIEVAKDMGVGEKTGVDLLGERAGILPDDTFLKERDLKWYLGDNVNLAIGQGYVSLTPIQMAQYAAIIANKGEGYQPHLLRAVIPTLPNERAKFTELQQTRFVKLDEQWWQRISRAMQRVVETGTGTAARVDGISIAGKTGSAEVQRTDKTNAWFIGYAPVRAPRVAIAVILEAAGGGGEAAAPVAGRIIEKYLKEYSN